MRRGQDWSFIIKILIAVLVIGVLFMIFVLPQSGLGEGIFSFLEGATPE